jgi:hypothetical protein
MNTYWNHSGKYQALSDKLMDELVPSQGKADTFGGELLRASGRIYYDAYNNGFLNNTSGALNFLQEWCPCPNLMEALRHLESKVNTGGYSDITSTTEKVLEDMVDFVVSWVDANPEKASQPNEVDLFEYQQDDYEEEPDEDDDVCDYCCSTHCYDYECQDDDEDDDDDR